jgi:hypothetical protein
MVYRQRSTRRLKKRDMIRPKLEKPRGVLHLRIDSTPQAHLIRDFKQLVGLPPAEYARTFREAARSNQAPHGALPTRAGSAPHR